MTWTQWQGRAAVGVVASAMLVVGGCNGANTPGDQGVDFTPKARGVSSAAPTAAAAAASPGPAASNYDDMPTPPKDAQYTIYCQAYAGPDHQEVARQVRDVLRANTGLRKWYVVHSNAQSTLYYGFYRSIDKRDKVDPAEGERAIADLDAVRTLHDSRGSRLFAASLPVPIDSPDPTANQAWDITRSGGYWSLEIAAFKDTPDRKARAVEAVADARKQGIDAYYYHGPHASSVCIGAWPRAAAAEVDISDQNTDANRPVVITPQTMSPKFAEGMDPNVQAVAPHVDPVDPSMLAAIQTYTEHSVNGYTLPKTDPTTGQQTTERPFLFRVPTADDASSLTADTAASNQQPDTAVAPTTSNPDAGQLHGLRE